MTTLLDGYRMRNPLGYIIFPGFKLGWGGGYLFFDAGSKVRHEDFMALLAANFLLILEIMLTCTISWMSLNFNQVGIM